MGNSQTNSEVKSILLAPRLPARLVSEQVADLLGMREHEIPILVKVRLLKPLGKPIPNAVKHFAACEIERCADDPKWLSQATQALYDHWKDKKKDNGAAQASVVGDSQCSLSE